MYRIQQKNSSGTPVAITHLPVASSPVSANMDNIKQATPRNGLVTGILGCCIDT